MLYPSKYIPWRESATEVEGAIKIDHDKMMIVDSFKAQAVVVVRCLDYIDPLP